MVKGIFLKIGRKARFSRLNVGHDGRGQRPGSLVVPVPGHLGELPNKKSLELRDRLGALVEPTAEKQGCCCLLLDPIVGVRSHRQLLEDRNGRDTS